MRYRRAEQSSLDADVDLFLKLHWMRWGDRVNLLTPARAPFLHDVARRMLEHGRLALWLLELDGEPVAAQFNLRYARTEVAFMPGMNPAFRPDHAGIVLTYHAIREAAAAGMDEVRLLRGDQPYKDKLPNRDHPVAHLLLSGSLRGDVIVTALTARRTLRRAVRRVDITAMRRRPAARAAVARPSAQRVDGDRGDDDAIGGRGDGR